MTNSENILSTISKQFQRYEGANGKPPTELVLNGLIYDALIKEGYITNGHMKMPANDGNNGRLLTVHKFYGLDAGNFNLLATNPDLNDEMKNQFFLSRIRFDKFRKPLLGNLRL